MCQGNETVSKAEIEQLLKSKKLDSPRDSDRVQDPSYGCDILLRRSAGDTRVTIFNDGHIAIPEACCAWLAAQTRNTTR